MDTDPAPAPTPASLPSCGTSLFAGRFEIVFDKPLSEFDQPSAKALLARDRSQPERRVFALVCTTLMPIRARAAGMLRGRRASGLLPLLEFGMVELPGGKASRQALIYERPAGYGLIEAADASPDAGAVVAREALKHLLPALRSLQEADIAHRSIRPDNIWFTNARGTDPALACGVCGPPAYDQPVAYEPIERAMAMPAGRGEGSTADDIFALGATMLRLLAGRELAPELTDEALILARIERGSFAVLSEGVRLPGSLTDVIRGMLADDPRCRWGLQDLQIWMTTRRISVRTAPSPFATRESLVIAGHQYSSRRAVALALGTRPAEADQLLGEGALESWLRHGAGDLECAKRIAELVQESRSGQRSSANNGDEALAARASIILDPAAPIRYRGLSFMVDGLGPVIAERTLASGQTQPAGEVVSLELVETWANQHPPDDPVATDALRNFRRWSDFLKSRLMGYGIERCLYDANPSLVCLAPGLAVHGVSILADLLPGLEAAASRPGFRPFDRHIAAFIAARSRKNADPLSAGLTAADPIEATLATLGTLAWLHRRRPELSLTNLARSFEPSLAPIIARYRHRSTRAAIRRDVQRAMEKGNLATLHDILHDPQRLQRDRMGFRAACAQHAQVSAEIARLGKVDTTRRLQARLRGEHLAALLGCAAALVAAGATIARSIT